jgi:hypothetical protein
LRRLGRIRDERWHYRIDEKHPAEEQRPAEEIPSDAGHG